MALPSEDYEAPGKPYMENDTPSDQWKEWFHQNGARLLLFARQQTRSEADAHDILQNAMVRLWKHAHRVPGDGEENSAPRPEKSPDAPPDLPLAYTAIRHAAIDHGRKHDRRVKREQASDYVVDDDAQRVDWFGSGELEDKEQREMLEEAVRALPKKFAEVLTLKIWGDHTFAQIAEILGIPQNTAASRYRYALDALRKSVPNRHP